jgi:CheY-like chemotaxis protein
MGTALALFTWRLLCCACGSAMTNDRGRHKRRAATSFRQGEPMRAKDSWPPLRVVYVDDNRDCADSAVLLLNLVGFEAKACYGGADALTLIESFQPGVCFIDLNMPGMSGDEVASRIRSSKGWQPTLLVAVTAASDERSRARIENAGFGMHLVKPVDPRNLFEVVENLFKMTSDDSSGSEAHHRTPGGKPQTIDPAQTDGLG